MDRVSDEQLDQLIKFMEFQMYNPVVICLLELRDRREAERKLSKAHDGDGVGGA